MGKKKIGILTLYYNNFNMGGLLQAYALQKTLVKLGYDAEQISFDYFRQGQTQKTKHHEISLLRRIVRKIKWLRDHWRFHIRENMFFGFMTNIPHSEKLYCLDNKIHNEYDIILTGSDQVWADWLSESALKCYLLENVDDDIRKYSYAASIGTDRINHSLDNIYVKGWKKFQHISVREESARREIKKLLPEADVRVDLDPTLLLTPDEWMSVAREKYINQKYIFCYFLGKDQSYREAAKQLAAKMGLPIVTMPYIKENRKEKYNDNFGKYNDYSSGPAEFVGIIKNAELVITDSFHAVAFSTQFHTKFYVLARIIEGSGSTNSRITDFLKQFGLEAQFIDVSSLNQIDIEKRVDFSVFDNKISGLREQSLAYLENL